MHNTFKTLVFLTILIVSCYSIQATDNILSYNDIHCAGTDKLMNNIDSVKDNSLNYYYNEDLISLWYGSNSWAIKFRATDFCTNFAEDDEANINVSGFKIYFPQPISEPISIIGYEYNPENDSFPLSGEQIPQISFDNVNITTTGWQSFQLSEPYLGSGLWFIINIPTAFDGPYIATSRGSGYNTYYQTTYNNQEFYNSFSNLSISQEFMISLDGYIESSTQIPTLLKCNFVDTEDVNNKRLTYTIRNFNSTAHNANINVSVASVQEQKNYEYPIEILAHGDTSDEDNNPILVPLDYDKSQYKLNVTIVLEDGTSIPYDSFIIDNITDLGNNAVIFNYLSNYDETNNAIIHEINSLDKPNWYVFNMSTYHGSPFFSNFAVDYYNNFDTTFMPIIAINGYDFFNSFTQSEIIPNLNNNVKEFAKIIDNSETQVYEYNNGFKFYDWKFDYGDNNILPEFSEKLEPIVLISQESKYYNDTANEYAIKSIELNEVTDKDLDEYLNGDHTIEGYSFSNIHNTEEGGGIGFINFQLAEFDDTLNTDSNGEIHVNMLIKEKESSKIVGFTRFALRDGMLVNNDSNDVESIPVINFYPNPVKVGHKLNYKSNNIINQISMYNIRGQKIAVFNPKDNNNVKVSSSLASGIYFMRSKDIHNHLTTKKILIIKE